MYVSLWADGRLMYVSCVSVCICVCVAKDSYPDKFSIEPK